MNDLEKQIREELLADFPQMEEQQIRNIVAIKMKRRTCKAKGPSKLVTVDMGDPNLSINYKKYLMSGEES